YEGDLIVNNFQLFQNYPNPFNPSTLIRYSLKKEELVSIEIYNILGQRVDELVKEVKSEGIHQIVFNSSNLPSGVYFYSIRTQNFTDTKKMILLR
ncbi:MAG: T9SS type A sorting domain-containing protein, partial [Ignavibacteriaceae bacterium]|nr:T9SS type A sorting domain-containing protein [Ignavibacteriaceae bacterium]